MEINYIFTLGRRCNSTQFLNHYNMRRYSSPFDWLIVDFETSIVNIKTKFKIFLNDLLIYNKTGPKDLLNSDSGVIDPLFKKLDELDVRYMTLNWNEAGSCFNQNFLPTNLTGNVYEWDRVCLFRHLTMKTHVDLLDKLRSRIDKFNSIFEGNHDKVLLFYISEIINKCDIEKREQEFVNIVKKYEMTNPFFIVLTVGEAVDLHLDRIDNVWFCIFQVPPYEKQILHSGNENCLEVVNYDEVYSLMTTTFEINTIDRVVSQDIDLEGMVRPSK